MSPRPSEHDLESEIVVLKVRLFLETQHLMLRHETVYPDTTGFDVKQRLWAKLPEQYRRLDCEMFMVDLCIQLELHEKILDNLRPMEFVLDQMNKEQIAVAKAVLKSALADFDASTVVPNHPVTGPSPKSKAVPGSALSRQVGSASRPVLALFP